MKKGRKTRQWEKARAELKKDFDRMGIRHCEGCGSTFNLSFAHRLKRRFIVTEDELRQVALLCVPCHQTIEQLTHSEMFAFINQLIEKREAVYA